MVGRVLTPSGPAQGFVALMDVKSGKVPQASVRRVDLSPRGFVPAFLVATLRDEIQPASLDTVPHVFVLSDSVSQVVQIPLPPGRSGRSRPLERTGFFEGRCSLDHPNERLPVWVFEHPYHAVLDAAGNFRLDSVPVGTFHLGMWSPAAGSLPAQVQELRVSSGGVDTVSMRLEAVAVPRE